MKIVMNNVIIIGGTHHNTLSMIRCLGKNGAKIEVFLYGEIDSYVAASKYISKLYLIKQDNDVLSLIRQRKSEHNTTIICCSDESASLMDKHYDEFCGNYTFFNCGKQGLLTNNMNKKVQALMAHDIGFDVPETIELKTSADIILINKYPCLLKPMESINGGKKIRICDSKEEVESILNDFTNTPILVQEYISKDYEIVITGLSIENRIIIPGYVFKHREELGSTSYSTIHPIAELEDEIVQRSESLVRAMHYEGLFGVECILSKGKYYFLEINLRNDATTYSIAVAGVNLPLIYLKAKSGDNYSAEIDRHIRQTDAIVEMIDVKNVFKGKVSPYKWYLQYKNSDCKYYYDKNDLKPFNIARKQFVNNILHKFR